MNTRREHVNFRAGAIWAILPAPDAVEATCEELQAAGFAVRVLVGAQDAATIDPSEAERGLSFFLTGAALTDATTFGENYAAAAREGRPVLQVTDVGGEKGKGTAATILLRHRATFVHYYGRWTVDELAPPAPSAAHAPTAPAEWRPRSAIHSETERREFEALVAEEERRGLDPETSAYVAERELHDRAGILSSFSGLVFVLLLILIAVVAGIGGLVAWLT